ncbi:MAG: putative response regulator, CheY [Acidimicrobiales bacterium]|nr:putative response regulator, CheY [Acidimicrobiales bacterium]
MKNLRIFLVEDHAMVRRALTEIIDDLLHARVIAWEDTESSATAWLEENSTAWDVAVVDMFLTQGSGLGVLNRRGIRARQRMVVLTNYATSKIRRKCLTVSADPKLTS